MSTSRDAIREGMNVIDAHGTHVGVVDRVDVQGDRLKLTRKDSLDGEHHYLPMALVAEVEDGNVRLSSVLADTSLFEE